MESLKNKIIMVEMRRIELEKNKSNLGRGKYIHQARIISCQVIQNKLISQLEDGREVSISINSLTK